MAAGRGTVIESLTGLNAEQRAEIIKWCDALGSAPLSISENPHTDIAYDELSQCFGRYYRQSYPSKLAGFARSHPQSYRKLIVAANRAMRCVRSWWPHERRIVQAALLRYLCRLAFDIATRRTLRVNWESVSDALGDTAATVNEAFPGWLRDGQFQSRTLSRIKRPRCSAQS